LGGNGVQSQKRNFSLDGPRRTVFPAAGSVGGSVIINNRISPSAHSIYLMLQQLSA